MGSWQLEVFKMALYISFPVGLFYLFNQPAFFEKYIMEKRETIWPPTDPKLLKMFEEHKRKMEQKEQQKWLAAQETKNV